jgi:hypothetical protein
MVTKSKKASAQESAREEQKGRVKVGKLKLNRETVKDLTGGKQKQIRGGELKITLRSCTETCKSCFIVQCAP